jgi:hypothetical protein
MPGRNLGCRRPPWQVFFVDFYLQAHVGLASRIGYDRFLSHSLQFISQRAIRLYIGYVTDRRKPNDKN